MEADFVAEALDIDSPPHAAYETGTQKVKRMARPWGPARWE